MGGRRGHLKPNIHSEMRAGRPWLRIGLSGPAPHIRRREYYSARRRAHQPRRFDVDAPSRIRGERAPDGPEDQVDAELAAGIQAGQNPGL